MNKFESENILNKELCRMTDNEIIKALECCKYEYDTKCELCCYNIYSRTGCRSELRRNALNLINRQKEEIERLNEHYKNLAKASVRHAFDTENDRQLLHEYQNIFLELGYGLREVQDPKLKEIKSWKDRAIWHVKRCDQFSKELKTAKSEAIKEFADRLKSAIYINTNLLVYQCEDVESVIDDIAEEMVGDTE